MKDIKRFNGRYKATEDGRIWSVKSKRFIGHNNHYGYKRATIRDEDGKYRTYMVHRLVAETYIPNPENKPCINHKDCDRSNNKITNLEWVTQSENVSYAKQLGRLRGGSNKGVMNGNAKFSDAIIKEIVESDMKQKDICKKYGVSRGYIWKLRAGQFRMGDEAKMTGGNNA